MLNRRHIRLKILQLLYSKKTGNIDNRSLLRQFNLSSKNFYKLILTQLLLFKELFDESNRQVELNTKKYFKNDLSIIENLFVNNDFFQFLNDSKLLFNLTKKYTLNYWTNNRKKVQKIYDKIIESEIFNNYANVDTNDSTLKYTFVEDIYRNIIAQDDEIYTFYQECEIGWSDDFPLVNSIVLNWILKTKINNSKTIPTKIFKDPSDKRFGKDLFSMVVKDTKFVEKIIDKYTPDWDNDRIAIIDKIILKMCIYEFTDFPSVPVKVSINEYVEISKEYSSPNSSTFINGVLNNIYKNFLEKNLIKKNEIGLQ
tara:strand:- start:1312 stop:2247 length:936 start_codon:yes stop_codon:yes gene_type:complete